MQAVGLEQSFFNVRCILKRKILSILFIFGLAAMTWAQGSGRDKPSNEMRRPAGETVTVSGSMVVSHGLPAVKSGDDTYFVRGINRLTGFVDGLKEGAQVTLEGRSFTSKRDSTLKFLRPAKLTLNGKDYDLTPLGRGFGSNRQFNAPGANRRHMPNGSAPQYYKYQRDHNMGPRDFKR